MCRIPVRIVLLALALLFIRSAQAAPTEFNVTDGQIENAAGGRFQVRTPEMRATLTAKTAQKITVNFTYLGLTKEVSHLASGEVRSQFGLKFRAQDICNLVYVMWHFSDPQGIAVSVKRNPGKQTHEQCLDHGYINDIKPRISRPSPHVAVDQPHTLSASMNGSELQVIADGTVVWEGDLGAVALRIVGPTGLRSDNAHVVFDIQ
jgi:hypothetical protein